MDFSLTNISLVHPRVWLNSGLLIPHLSVMLIIICRDCISLYLLTYLGCLIRSITGPRKVVWTPLHHLHTISLKLQLSRLWTPGYLVSRGDTKSIGPRTWSRLPKYKVLKLRREGEEWHEVRLRESIYSHSPHHMTSGSETSKLAPVIKLLGVGRSTW